MNKRIEALLYLLEDPDEEVFTSVQEGLLSLTPTVIPYLEDRWERSSDPLVQQRIERVLDVIRLEDAKNQLSEWMSREQPRLLECLYILNRFQYPGIPEERYRSKMERIVREVFQASRLALTELAKVRVINHVLFDVYRLVPTPDGNSPHPARNFVYPILDTGFASPMGLLCLYIALSEQIGLSLLPVPLPRHFILACTKRPELSATGVGQRPPDILFYLNPFGKGATFSEREIEHFLRQHQVQPSPMYTQPIPVLEFVGALLGFLSNQYSELGHANRALAYSVLQRQVNSIRL